MKTFIKYILQKILGLKRYLYTFALFNILKFHLDKKEKDFFQFISLISDGGKVLDLGANIGVTSYFLSKKLKNSTILSFEPIPINMEILKKLKKQFKLKNIKEYLLAVGNKNTKIKMVMPVIKNVPMHGLSHVISSHIKKNNSGIIYDTKMIKLDDFKNIVEPDKKITGIKIDIENYEFAALQGLEKTIKKDKPIIYCELWKNKNRENCIYYLTKFDYHPFIFHKSKFIDYHTTDIPKNNFFFIHNSLLYLINL